MRTQEIQMHSLEQDNALCAVRTEHVIVDMPQIGTAHVYFKRGLQSKRIFFKMQVEKKNNVTVWRIPVK